MDCVPRISADSSSIQAWSAICLNLGVHVVMCKLHIYVIARESSLTWLVDYYYFAVAGGAKLWVRSL